MQSLSTALRCCAIATFALWAAAAGAQDTAITNVATAVRVALERSPAARPAELRREARLAERVQAGSWVNPEAGIDAENVTGSGAYRSAGSIELTGRISQRFELGGKREARTGTADANVSLADIELEIVRLDIARNAATGLVEAVAVARSAALDRDRSRLAEDTLGAVRARITAGREPPTAAERAEAALATARVAATRSAREAELARRRLALTLGVAAVAIIEDPPWFADPPAAPADDATRAPQLAKADAELAKARAKLEQEVAVSAPDVTLSGGIRYYRETQDAALVVGLSVPIPVLNRNRGGIAAARQELVAAEAERQLVERSLLADIEQGRQQLELARTEADVLRGQVLPAAERAFGAAREGYAAGKLPLLEVLDAQRALIETRDQLNKALRDGHLRRIELARLAGSMPDSGPRQGG
jgi:outer membrane protein, heavy metal efflux system